MLIVARPARARQLAATARRFVLAPCLVALGLLGGNHACLAQRLSTPEELADSFAKAGVPADVDGKLATAETLSGARPVGLIVPPTQDDLLSLYDQTLTSQIFRSLRGEKLTPAQLARIRAAVLARHYPLESLRALAGLLREQDQEHWPEMLLALLQSPLREPQAPDVFPLSAMDGLSLASSGEMRLEEIASKDFGRKDPDPRLVPAARHALRSVFLPVPGVATLPETLIRDSAMRYLSVVDTPESRTLLLELLDSPWRSVAGAAATLAGQRRMKEAAPGLHRLAASPSPQIRAVAMEALHALGEPAPAYIEPPETMAAANKMGSTLRTLGLTDAMILHVLAGTSGAISTAYRLYPGKQRPDPFVALTDSWRIQELDAASVRKRAAQYHDGYNRAIQESGIHFLPYHDMTGPFLLAAAVAVNDPVIVRQVYADICDEFESDDDALQAGINYVARPIFSAGLDDFFLLDEVALAQDLRRLEMFAPYAPPGSELALLVRKGRKLATTNAQRIAHPPPTGPEPAETPGRIAHWIARLPEMHGAAYPGWLWREPPPQLSFSKVEADQGIDARDFLRGLGRAALPALVEAVGDATPTRVKDDPNGSAMVRMGAAWPDASVPARWVSVGEVAQAIIAKICEDASLPAPAFRISNLDPPFQTRERFRAWLKTLPPPATP